MLNGKVRMAPGPRTRAAPEGRADLLPSEVKRRARNVAFVTIRRYHIQSAEIVRVAGGRSHVGSDQKWEVRRPLVQISLGSAGKSEVATIGRILLRLRPLNLIQSDVL